MKSIVTTLSILGLLMLSANTFAQWEKVGASSAYYIISVNGKLYTAYDGGMQVSDDNGATWVKKGEGLSGLSAFIFSVGYADGYFYLGTYAGVYRSNNEGDTWEIANTGLSASSSLTYATRFFEIDGATYLVKSFLKSFGGGVYKTTDHGSNWTAITENVGSSSEGFYNLVKSNGTYFLSTNLGFYKSTDLENWDVITLPAGATGGAFGMTSRGNKVYSLFKGKGLYVTEDAAATWDTVTTKYFFGIGDEVIAAPDGAIYVLASNYGVWFSPNEGTTWQDLSGNLSSLGGNTVSMFDLELHNNDLWVVGATTGIFVYKGVPVSVDDAVVTDFTLLSNYPNPFNPSTTIHVEVQKAGTYSLTIYNGLGQQIHTLHNGQLAAGSTTFNWNGTGLNGVPMPTGMYFARLTGEGFSGTHKMTLLK